VPRQISCEPQASNRHARGKDLGIAEHKNKIEELVQVVEKVNEHAKSGKRLSQLLPPPDGGGRYRL
jgi:hypothetical protein